MHKKGFLPFAFALVILLPVISYGQMSYQEENNFYSYDENESSQYYQDQNGYPSRAADEAGYISMQPEYDEPQTSSPESSSSYTDNLALDDDPDENDQLNDEEPKSKVLTDGRLPIQIPPPGEKIIVIDPKAHAWGAYLPNGQLIRSGLASAGAKWCKDRGRPCRTKVGSFRIFSLGDSSCVSSIYPLNEGGGAPMPYCMFFNGNQGLHGSYQLAEANISHGCVRVSVSDAKWIRYKFARIGTKVIVKPY